MFTASRVSLGPVDRRIAGGLLLVVALVCTLAVPNMIGRDLAGSAVGEVIAGPPAVGSCVSAVSRDTVAPGQLNSANADEAVLTPALPVATITPCRGQVVGEIISVTAATTAQASTLQEYDDAHPACRSRVESYLGTIATTDVLGVQWTKSIYVDAVAVGPDVHDRAAGRTWSACVVSAVHQMYLSAPTLRSSWRTGTLPAAFGLCWADAVVAHGVPTACTAPHTTQQLARGFVSAPSDDATSIVSAADPAAVAAGCRQVAAGIMKVKDPTFGGALAIGVVNDPTGAPYVQCVARATRGKTLTGSLIGLAAGPLPLS